MSYPQLYISSNIWALNRDPQLTEIPEANNLNEFKKTPIQKYDYWHNTQTNDFFRCINDTQGSLQFIKISSSTGITIFAPANELI